MTSPDQILLAARGWLGVRWCHQGRDRLRGVDCAGLLICVARQLNLSLTDRPSYGRRHDGKFLMRDLHKQLKYISTSICNNGDIGVFKNRGYLIHVGFLSMAKTGDTVIHAHARRRKVVEEPLDQFGRPSAVFRLPEVR